MWYSTVYTKISRRNVQYHDLLYTHKQKHFLTIHDVAPLIIFIRLYKDYVTFVLLFVCIQAHKHPILTSALTIYKLFLQTLKRLSIFLNHSKYEIKYVLDIGSKMRPRSLRRCFMHTFYTLLKKGENLNRYDERKLQHFT